MFDRYQKYSKVTEILPVNCLGVQTHRDSFVIDFDRAALKHRIRMFRDKSLPDEITRQTFGLKDNRDWKMSPKRKAIISDERWEEKITKILYRPFDVRWIFYHKDAIDFGRPEVMRHMLHDNLALNTMRQTKMPEWRYAVVSNMMAPAVYVEIKDGCNLFPLYLCSDGDKKDLFTDPSKATERKPNLDPSLLRMLKETYDQELTPEEIFFYIYAVLYSTSYRTKYAEFLKTDFPRVPFTRGRELFTQMAHLGEKLVGLHLLKLPELDPPIARFQGTGDSKVEKQLYSRKEKRVYINKTQYFEAVEPEVWKYQIGGYQVLDKWLKDRKGRSLSLEDIRHYCRVTALSKTIAIQAEIESSLS